MPRRVEFSKLAICGSGDETERDGCPQAAINSELISAETPSNPENNARRNLSALQHTYFSKTLFQCVSVCSISTVQLEGGITTDNALKLRDGSALRARGSDDKLIT